MEVGAEAKRIMVVALGKLYSSRIQRGGLRLHRSLLLTMVMKSARDMYHAAAQTAEEHGLAAGCEREEILPETVGANVSTESPVVTGPPETSSREQEEVIGAATAQGTEPTHRAHRIPHGQLSRKRRGNASVEPDFLPCKKAKLDCPLQLVVLMDYMTCSDLGAAPSPIPVHRAIAAC